IVVESHLIEGTAFLKVSLTKQQQKIFRVDVDQVNIESIKELLIGKDIRCYREHFNLSADFEPRWFTITYVDSGRHKILHLIAPTLELFNIWVNNLKKLYLHRMDVIGGLGHLRKREFLLLEQQWKQVDKDGDSRLGFDDIANLCNNLNIYMTKAVLKTEFNRFNKLIKKRAELDELFNSLAKERRNTLTLREFKDFLVNYSLKEDEYDKLYSKFCDKNHKEMNLEGFSYFLMSSDNAVFASERIKVYQDMKQPLSHYFIDSSHNTYVRICLKVTPYPLIISLENHCSIDQQNQMASILCDTLGDSLVTGVAYENAKELQSPTSLLYKILLKGNKLPSSSSEGYVEVADPNAESSKGASFKDTTKLKMSKTLSDLIAYSIVKFDGFDYEHSKYYHVYNFSNQTSSKYIKSDKAAFTRQNTLQLTRIYPSGLRIDSSNYQPHHQWIVGNQLVSLNWQSFDLGMQIDHAMFAVNGSCGYVLKPERLRNPKIISSAMNTQSTTQTLTIEIISGQQLPKPKGDFINEVIDPFVEVELHIPGADAIKNKTKTISDNGFNPTWKETLKFTFNCEELSLVFLRFVVWDQDLSSSSFVGSYCIPVTSLQF
ncbi:28395_t:CDS:10, partial [Racocetra persica]